MFSLAQRRTAAALPARSFVTVSQLTPKVKVAAVDNGSQTASLTLVLKGGSRYEPSAGVANVVKNFAFKSNKFRSALGNVRTAEHQGAVLSSTLTREQLLLTAQFLRGDEELFVNMLHNELFPTLKRHELEEQVVPVTALESQRSASEPLTATLEAAHRVAFRSGLGNSIFATQEEPVTLSQVAAHVSKLRADEVALIGTGISHETLVKLAEPLFGGELTYELEEAGYDLSVKQSTVPSVYKGGESRAAFDLHSLESHGPSVVIAYGVTGKDKVPSLAEATVLGQLLGGSPAIKWSSGSSPLAQAASAVEGQATARAFVQSYSDAALLCIQIEAEGTKRLSEVAAHAGKTVKSLQSVSKEQLARAVAQAKYEIAAKSETDEGLVELVAPQIFSGKVDDLKTVFAALDAITPESISKTLASFTASKPSVASVARLSQMAYADDLGL